MDRVRMSKASWTAMALGIAFWVGSSAPLHAAPVGLGAAADFGLLVDAGDLSMGDHSIVRGTVGVWHGDSELGYQCYVTRDLADTNITPASVTLGESTHVVGQCSTSAGGTITLDTGATCGSQDTTGGAARIADLNQAVLDEEAFETVVAGLPTTQTLPAINLGFSQTMKVFDAVHGGVNVIHVPSVTLGNFAVLYISGGVEDQLVFVIDGPLSIGKRAKIVLIGGLLKQNTFIDAQSLTIADDYSSMQGTVHVEGGCPLGEEVTINGGLICDGTVTTGKFLRLNAVANQLAF